MQYDLCVVGGGLAGLTAALRANELKLRTCVLEQGAGADYACNSRYAGGMMHLAFEDIALPPDELAQRLLAKAPADMNRALIGAIGSNSRRTLEWLIRSGGARFIRGGSADWQRWCLAPVRPRQPGLVWPGRGTDRLLRNLAAGFTAGGGRLILNARVQDLTSRPGGGYEIASEDGSIAVTARAVILADGGFQADADMLQQRLAPQPGLVLRRNAGTGSGFALRSAPAIGAAISPVDRFYGHLVARDALTNERLWPWPTLDELAVAGLLVDERGQSFGEAAGGGVYLANLVAASGREAFVVLDNQTWEYHGRRGRIVPCNPMLPRLGGTVFVGDDLAALARQAGVDADGLAQTERDNPGRLVSPPFRIIPAAAGITYTMSGLEVDAELAVRDLSDGVISGLFAAGATVGGAEGGESAFYLGGLAKAAITGLVAAESAAKLLSADRG